MQFWLYDHSTNTRQAVEADAKSITIGRDEACDITLKSPFVARKHARVFLKGNQIYVEALSRAGTRVANRELNLGKPIRIDFGDEIQLGQFSLAPIGADRGGAGDDDQAQQQARLMELEKLVHAELLERMNLRVTGHINKSDQAFVTQMLEHLDQVLTRRVEALDESVLNHARSEERRVGKECRSRWSPYH